MHLLNEHLQATFLWINMSTLSTGMVPNPSDFMHCFNMLIQRFNTAFWDLILGLTPNIRLKT